MDRSVLQQYLPFTVLKQSFSLLYHYFTLSRVATVPTVYGIETLGDNWITYYFANVVATVLTVYDVRRRVRDNRGAKRR